MISHHCRGLGSQIPNFLLAFYGFWLPTTSSSTTASNVLKDSSSSLTLGWDFFFFLPRVKHKEKRPIPVTPPIQPEGTTQQSKNIHKEKWMWGARIIGSILTFMPDYLKSANWGLDSKCLRSTPACAGSTQLATYLPNVLATSTAKSALKLCLHPGLL